jgi:hypothetical protein
MNKSSFEFRFETAMRAHDVAAALLDLAGELKTEGLSQGEVFNLFQNKLSEHITDPESNLYDEIHNVMDAITGHCEKGRWIFQARI